MLVLLYSYLSEVEIDEMLMYSWLRHYLTVICTNTWSFEIENVYLHWHMIIGDWNEYIYWKHVTIDVKHATIKVKHTKTEVEQVYDLNMQQITWNMQQLRSNMQHRHQQWVGNSSFLSLLRTYNNWNQICNMWCKHVT